MATAADKLVLDPRGSAPGAVSATGYLASGLSATLVLRLTTLGLSFVALVLLGRLLGPEGYGQYAYLMATVAILGPLAAAGMPSIVVREVAACRSRGDYARLKGVVLFAFIAGSVASVILALGWWLLELAADAWSTAAAAGDHLLAGFALLLLATLAAPLGAMQQGLKRIVAAQIPGAVVQPLATVLLLLLAWWAWRPPLDVRGCPPDRGVGRGAGGVGRAPPDEAGMAAGEAA